MATPRKTYSSIDEYIAEFPQATRVLLEQIRRIIRNVAPDAVETISYQMPTFKLKKNLVHFAAFKSHIGFYPLPDGIENFKEEFSRYKSGKGSIQFPLDEPLPVDLIERIVRFRVKAITGK